MTVFSTRHGVEERDLKNWYRNIDGHSIYKQQAPTHYLSTYIFHFTDMFTIILEVRPTNNGCAWPSHCW